MPQELTGLDHSVSIEEAHAELEAVLRSGPFERSERLQRFLRYICELTLNGESARINEYLIGSEVFRKGANYNPNEDSVVRRQAHTLRQKLHEYYAGEGNNRLVRIELPVGRYVPVFRRQDITTRPNGSASVSDPPPAGAQTAPLPSPQGNRGRLTLILVAAFIFLAGLITGLVWRSKDTSPAIASRVEPAMKEIWGPWLTEVPEAVICFSNPMTAVVKHFEKPLPKDSVPKRFPMDPDAEAVFREVLRLPPGGKFYFTPVLNQTKMGEAISGVLLARFFAAAGVQVNSAQSRFLGWEAFRKQSFILLGHNEANQWIDPLLKPYPFHLTPTSGKQQRSIVNTLPGRGEQGDYKIAYSDEANEADQEYALVSMLPGFEKPHRLLLISGLNTQATQMATEYLTTERTLAELLASLRAADPQHAGPWYFQAVFKTEVHDSVPTRISLVKTKVIK